MKYAYRFHRNKDSQSFRALPETVTIGQSHVHGSLKSKNGENNLEFDLFMHRDKILRLKINEDSPARERYEIPEGDVVQPLELQKWEYFVICDYCLANSLCCNKKSKVGL